MEKITCDLCDKNSKSLIPFDVSYMSFVEQELIYDFIEKKFGKRREKLGSEFYICKGCTKLLIDEYNRKFNGRK
ncbi:MAG: hypothetical protein J7L43_02910 [Candidatus Aenigmarchaeota archaeon]|nr:hypothetical protein [Candidatus Aenigmarchaeota archaeon]